MPIIVRILSMRTFGLVPEMPYLSPQNTSGIMKQYLVVCLSLIFPLVSFSQEKLSPKVLRGVEAQEKYPGTTIVREGKNSTIPSYIQFNRGSKLQGEDLSSWLIATFHLDPLFGLIPAGTERDHLGYIHYRFQQTFRNIPIEFTMFITHNIDGAIHSMNGMLISDPPEGVVPTIAEATALQKALDNVNADQYRWESEKTELPKGEIVFVPPSGDFKNPVKLAWKFDIYAYEPLYKADVFIDASTGAILFEHDMIHTVNDTGTAVTGYSGTVQMVTDSFASDSFRLRETGRGNGIESYDMNKGTNYGNAVDFIDADNFWNNINAQWDQFATDAQWGSEMTYDYFMIIHGRNSIDDAGFKLKSYVHYGNNYRNAFWNGSQMTYGDGNSSKPYQCLDVCGHEITHGLTSKTSSLIYSKESGALNESFSDIFGTLIEFYGKPDSANWLIGENLGNPFRNMSNPKAKGDPDCYLGVNWHTTSNDNYGVHTNSGVQNHWFYILSEGKTGVNDNSDTFSVAGLGMSAAANIAFRSNTIYLFPSADHEDARFFFYPVCY